MMFTKLKTRIRAWREKNPPDELAKKLDRRFKATVIGSSALLLVAAIAGTVTRIYIGDWATMLASAVACVLIAVVLQLLTRG